MKKFSYLFFALTSLAFLITGCEKVEDKVYILENVVPPEIVSLPDMMFDIDHSGDSLIFVGTPVDPGFVASANYYLEACPTGTNFESAILVVAGTQDTAMYKTVDQVNSALVKKIPEFETSTIDFRIRAALKLDSGTGALGSSKNPMEYVSATVTQDVYVYGEYRLVLLNSGKDQNLPMTEDDGIYAGRVILDPAKPLTLYEPESKITYGGSGGVLSVNGPAIVPQDSGKYDMSVDVNAMTYELTFIPPVVSGAQLDIIGSGIDQSIPATEDEGVFVGFIKLSTSNPFTLNDPSTGKSYGGSGGTLEQDGAALDPTVDGWHKLTVDLGAMTYTLMPYSVGVVGANINNWGAGGDDVLMEYEPDNGYWTVTMDVPEGGMKFRINNAWDIRWGPGSNTDLPDGGGVMNLPNSDADIIVTSTSAGNYTIQLTITSDTTGSANFILNN